MPNANTPLSVKEALLKKLQPQSLKDILLEKALLGALEDGDDILIPNDFAYVPTVEKPSTWRLRADTPENVQASVIEFKELLDAGVLPSDAIQGIKQRLATAWVTYFPERDYPELIKPLDVTENIPEENKLLAALTALLSNFGATQKAAKTEVVKAVNEEQRMVMVVTLQPEVADAHGDIYSADEIEKACVNFNVNCNRANLLHKAHTSAVKIVQSYITMTDIPLEDGRLVLKGSWVQWLYVDTTVEGELIWKSIKDGDLIGISIGCMAEAEEIEDDE